MPIVFDSSIAMALAMDDEDLPDTDVFLERLARERAIVPAHWAFEVANSLISAARRGRMPSVQGRIRYNLVKNLPIDVDAAGDEDAMERTIHVALEYGLTVYDAAYLELAIRLSLPLATLDKALARAARAEDAEVIGG